MSTRLPLGWARILDCLPSSELSAASGLAPSEALPIQPAAGTAFQNGSLTADPDSMIRFSHGISSVPTAPNLVGVAQPVCTPSLS